LDTTSGRTQEKEVQPAERGLFKDVIVREGGKVTVHMWETLSGHIKAAHDQVKANRGSSADTGTTPPSDPAPPA